MVKFEGTLSDKCVLYRIKSADREIIIGMVITVLIGVLLVSILFYVPGIEENEITELIVWVGLGAVLLLILALEYKKHKKPRVNVFIELTADSDFITYTISAFKPKKMPTKNIKKVIKVDRCYYLVQKWGGALSSSIMVEEDILKEGTIEEFEMLFNGKIEVRENK